MRFESNNKKKYQNCISGNNKTAYGAIEFIIEERFFKFTLWRSARKELSRVTFLLICILGN